MISPDADGNESETGISRALGTAFIGWQQSADTMSDWVVTVESMQEIVSEIKKEQRRLYLYQCPRRQPGNTKRDLYRRQIAARGPGLAFTSRSMEES